MPDKGKPLIQYTSATLWCFFQLQLWSLNSLCHVNATRRPLYFHLISSALHDQNQLMRHLFFSINSARHFGKINFHLHLDFGIMLMLVSVFPLVILSTSKRCFEISVSLSSHPFIPLGFCGLTNKIGQLLEIDISRIYQDIYLCISFDKTL